MQILNPSTSAKPLVTKLQNLFVALVNLDIFQMTLNFSSLTGDKTSISSVERFPADVCLQNVCIPIADVRSVCTI